MNWPDLNVDAFQSVDAATWLELIKKELKGKDAAWLAEAGVTLSPFVHRDNNVTSKKLPPKSLLTQGNDWLITQEFQSNSELLEGLISGVGKVVVNFKSESHLRNLIEGVYLNMVELSVRCHWENRIQVAQTIAVMAGKAHVAEIQLSLNHDPISDAFDANNIHAALSALSSLPANSGDVKAILPKTRIVNVEACRLYEAGASHALEVAYALATGRRYLDAFVKAGWSVDDASPLIQFSLAADSDYFLSIAKFRSFRLAWAALIEGYGAQYDCSVITWINGVTSTRVYDNNDLYNNLLRSTISTMSAVIGGADAVLTSTYNQANDADALRWARNIQHLLCDESGLDKVYDPGFGIGYVEQATQEVLNQVYAFLNEWSNAGELVSIEGFNWLRNELDINQKRLVQEVNNGDATLVGINKFLLSDEGKVLVADKSSGLAAMKLANKEGVQ
jgi:methylmalonyl-CoA mutase